jgi:hypothetical protein
MRKEVERSRGCDASLISSSNLRGQLGQRDSFDEICRSTGIIYDDMGSCSAPTMRKTDTRATRATNDLTIELSKPQRATPHFSDTLAFSCLPFSRSCSSCTSDSRTLSSLGLIVNWGNSVYKLMLLMVLMSRCYV